MMKLLQKFILISAFLSACACAASAQSEVPTYEVGAQFSLISLDDNDPIISGNIVSDFKDLIRAGGGGRFTYNLSEYVGFEIEANFFVGETRFFAPAGSGGHMIQAVAGVKAGKRFRRFGVFAKGRPGFVSFSEGTLPANPRFRPNEQGLLVPQLERATHLAFDLGGVVEFYASRRFVTRFDAGDTIIRYSGRDIPNSGVPPIRIPAETRHNFQLSAGVGFRFQ